MSLLDHPPPPPGAPPPDPLDVAVLSDEELLAELGVLEAEQRRLDAARMALLGETHARAVTERHAGLTVKAWLGHQHHVAPATAAKQCATAKKLRLLLPEIAEALAAGVITFDHAALVAKLCTPRVEAIVVGLQARFIELAQVQRFEPWTHDVRGLISLADQDGPGPLGEPQNRLRMTDGLDGALHLDVDLVGVDAQRVRAALLEQAERAFRAHLRKDQTGQIDECDPTVSFDQFPGRNELLAEALIDLISRGCATRPNAPSPVTDVTLVVQASGPLDARTPDGVRLQDGTTRELLCDAVFRAVVVDRLGVPIDQGHASRLFKPEQRRAIMIRDGGCGGPGCDAPWDWLQIHHVAEWDADDGPTDQANGLPACSYHHHLWHSDGWTVMPDPDTHHLDQGFIMITPEGDILRSQRHGRPRPLVIEMGLEGECD